MRSFPSRSRIRVPAGAATCLLPPASFALFSNGSIALRPMSACNPADSMSDRPIINVLVFPGGTEVGLEIFRALRHCKEVRLHAAASGVKHHASFCYALYRDLPEGHEPGCLDALL